MCCYRQVVYRCNDRAKTILPHKADNFIFIGESIEFRDIHFTEIPAFVSVQLAQPKHGCQLRELQ